MKLPPLPEPVRRALRAWHPLALLTLLGCAILFVNYGAGALNRWDEGLYGRFARNALTFGDFLLPLDESGRYASEPFSKPPLSFLVVALSFELFGPSLGALRLPFTLGMLLTALVCFAWGNDLSRHYRLPRLLGFLWGLFLLLSEASMRWGRYAVIEDLFVMWLVMALWLHTRAILRSPYWAFGAGIALSLAFLTKQLAFGLAVLPMLGVELSVLRRDGLRRVAFRSVMWGVPPLVCAATWAGLGYAREGKRFVDMLWDFALAQRFQGYSGTVHFNSLNRVAGVLEEVCQPFSWPVATLGLWLFGCHAYRRGGRRARAALAVVLLLLACVAVIENTSKSVLPWYSFSLMPAFGLGWAWLVTQGYRVARVYWRRPRRPLQLVWGAHAGLGAYVLYSALIASARGIVSQVNVALLLLAVASLASAARFARAPWARRVPGATLGLGLALLTVAHFRHTEYRVSPRATDAMMGILGAAGAERPVVSRSVNASDPAHYEPITLFGTHVSFGPEPWRGHAKSSADAFADLVVVPEEALPPPGIRLHRVAGGSVWTGDMSLDPLPQASLEGLLAQGPLTFEAEHMDSSRDTSLVSDRRASGGRARRYKAWLSEGNKDHVLSRATTTPLPPGKYVAVVYLRWRCGPQSGSRVGQIRAGGAKRELGCKGPDRLANYQPIALSFGVERAEGVSSSVTFRRGRGELWHDKTELWRVDVWQARASATP